MTCPECGEKDAARFPEEPPVAGPPMFISACAMVLSVHHVLQGGPGVAGMISGFAAAVFAVAMGCFGAYRVRDWRRSPGERRAVRAWVALTVAWAGFLVWAVVR